MIEIKTQEDMMLLFQNDVIDKAISEFIGDYFKNLMNTFIDNSTASEFNLEEIGHIIILEAKR